MKKILFLFLLILFPLLAFADGSLSFSPPASDFSVVFLGNLFGVVDGILHGTGSQIMGSMFAVFNAAVLALGGIVITYTLLVSTMNTAQEGQMLGQKWSSIWVPVRSVIGLTLLIPKASGYCLMQIFVMWVVVQGVGAADKVWDAALSYLNRGGVIIQGQSNPAIELMRGSGSGVPLAAQVMLAGQVCMQGIQTQLENQLDSYKTQKANSTGPCFGQIDSDMKEFCDSSVPNFISSVDFIRKESDFSGSTTLTMDMPNFPDGLYHFLNGVCGQITWNRFEDSRFNSTLKGLVSESDLKTARMSRVIAIQQMYLDLSSLAQVMVENNPSLIKTQNLTPNGRFSEVALQQFGVPLTPSGQACTDGSDPNCVLWGDIPGSNGAPLFNGTEFQGAIADYNGIMEPTLNLINQGNSDKATSNSHAFIQDASTQGWMMAGSYFFDLVNLNIQANDNSGTTDSATGLEKSTIDLNAIIKIFGGSLASPNCVGVYGKLCLWLNKDPTKIIPMITLVNGWGMLPSTITAPDAANPVKAPLGGLGSSTVYGYTNNATVLKLPGQPGMNPLKFAANMNISVDTNAYQLPETSFGCGELKIMFWSTCLMGMFGDLLYNYLFRFIYNFFLQVFQTFLNLVVMTFLQYPLLGMKSIFDRGLSLIDTPGVNPVVALAQMGTYYINYVSNLWIDLIELAITCAMIPVFGAFIFVIIMMLYPMLLAWLGVMTSVGYSTAYYVPVMPYMVFTFGTIAWLMAVIESMVAAPIVALGVTHPEGHDAFGKGEQAIMILMNVFLRPSMMIIGYIAAIAVSYVSVWIINAGFDNAIGFIQGSSKYGTEGAGAMLLPNLDLQDTPAAGAVSGGYTGWAGIYAYFFSILIYTSLYVTVVTKAFTLISILPDKVLRWIGGTPESYGQDTSQWGEETKGKVDKAGESTQAAQMQMGKQLGAEASKGLGKAQQAVSESGGANVKGMGEN
jgi:defect-in-organelle-trafficking protein DotA